MASTRALVKRRKAIRNIRKITRTMELIATARFKKAMDRATASTAYTRRITQLVTNLVNSGLEVSHPLLEGRETTKSAILLVLTGNRGLCGGYNGNVQRLAMVRWEELKRTIPKTSLEISGKRGIAAFKFRGITPANKYTHFEDRPSYGEVELLANRYLDSYTTGELDRLDVAYTRFEGISKQIAVVETLLPLGTLTGAAKPVDNQLQTQYEFLPSAASILEEVVPASFKVRLFKCFLDAAVSEQVARMVAMKSATENADDLIKSLSMTYNRARQGQITSELLDIVGGVEALNK